MPAKSGGLSPRTRRNPWPGSCGRLILRSISAHAEEPDAGRILALYGEVYLRARGGTGDLSQSKRASEGLSPRTRRNPD
ncbi:Hypothetical protein GbCGDNIH6_8027 [Granulibacter bethesdensis]|nr:Hypothetical protein GbCGDNIH6_8027 [Granulibacter bethesdensis]